MLYGPGYRMTVCPNVAGNAMAIKPHPDVLPFDRSGYDPDRGIYKLGEGELGGKANGLALLDKQLERSPFTSFHDAEGGDIRVVIPPTLVIATDLFDRFLQRNRLDRNQLEKMPDDRIAKRIGRARIPESLETALRHFLRHHSGCLAVRSSSMMEDSRQYGYAGLYRSVMLANDHLDINQRLARLTQAIKQVYASTFFKAPHAYARRLGHSIGDEKMAVMIQPVIGAWHNELFLPAISGIAQSLNFYPLPPMRHEDGLVTLAVGLGQTVVSGEKSLRFSPKHPQHLPQRSSVAEVLDNSQTHFYALKRGQGEADTLVRLALPAITDAPFMRYVASTWNPADDRIRDTVQQDGTSVLTFAPMLKQELFPLPGIIASLLERGQRLMDCPVEMEFAVDLARQSDAPSTFGVLQLRPMSTRPAAALVHIEASEIEGALCYSRAAMGNADDTTMADIVYIKPEHFDPSRTRDTALQVARFNAALTSRDRRYVLIGPGRWGSQDPWLGIPVRWQHISGVGAIVETGTPELRAEFSQGAHLFHNLMAAGICYLCISQSTPDRIDWQWLAKQAKVEETDHVAHIRLSDRLRLRVDGRTACGVISVLKTA